MRVPACSDLQTPENFSLKARHHLQGKKKDSTGLKSSTKALIMQPELKLSATSLESVTGLCTYNVSILKSQALLTLLRQGAPAMSAGVFRLAQPASTALPLGRYLLELRKCFHQMLRFQRWQEVVDLYHVTKVSLIDLCITIARVIKLDLLNADVFHC